MRNISFQGTWADLLRGLLTLAPEQLARPIEASNDADAFPNVSLEITTVRHYFFPDGDWAGDQSDYERWTQQERESVTCEEPGHVWLCVEKQNPQLLNTSL